MGRNRGGGEATAESSNMAEASSRPAVVVFDRHGVIRRWDAGAEQLYGHAPASAIGGQITLLMPTEARADWLRLLDRVRAGDRVLEHAAVHLTKDGQRVHVDAEWSPLGKRPGSGGVLTAVDRTERVISQREHTALLAVAHAASTTGPKDLMCSVAARALHGGLQPRATLIQIDEGSGLHVVARLGIRSDAPPAALDVFHRAAAAAHETGKVGIGTDVNGLEDALTTRRESASGALVTVPLVAEDERFGVLQVVVDSYRRARPTQVPTLRVAAHFLGMALKDRSLVSRLEGTIEELRRVNAELDNYAHAVAHDLSEPLRSIRGFSRLLLEMDEGERTVKAEDYLHRIEAGAARLRDMLGALREHARAGREAQEAEDVPLDEVVDAVRDSLSAYLAERRGKIETSGPLPHVHAPRTHLFEVLLNLVANGLKFNDSRRPRVTIRSQPQDGTYRIRVEDNGVGVPASVKDRVFELFARGHPAGQYPGTGAGLAISSKYVRRWGGVIDFEANDKTGTRFWFTVPPAVGEAPVPRGGPSGSSG